MGTKIVGINTAPMVFLDDFFLGVQRFINKTQLWALCTQVVPVSRQSKEFLAGAKGLSVSLLAFADSSGTPTGTAYALDIN